MTGAGVVVLAISLNDKIKNSEWFSTFSRLDGGFV
jgi:hypothetical protein